MSGIHTAESAVWHALMTKSQLVSKIQLPHAVESYLSDLVIRAMQARSVSAEQAKDALIFCSEQNDLHQLGDECLVLAGLMPERAIEEEIPVSYFVNVAYRAYSQLGDDGGERIYTALAEHLIDCIDVLHTLRELEVGGSCIDPLNAFELWEETGSRHAWQCLARLTDAVPAGASSLTVH